MIITNRQQRRALKAENASWPPELKQIPRASWAEVRLPPNIKEVWRSRDFLVQVFEVNGVERLSVCRTEVADNDWREGIAWDELQRLKRECGRGAKDAVELFPADDDVVNVANMRHLWIVGESAVPFKWKARRS
jgi:hypothetical protein